MEAAFVTLIKTQDSEGHLLSIHPDTSRPIFRLLMLTTYTALALNSSVIISSLVLIDALAELPYKNAQDDPLKQDWALRKEEAPTLMKRFHYRGLWVDLVSYHCEYVKRKGAAVC